MFRFFKKFVLSLIIEEGTYVLQVGFCIIKSYTVNLIFLSFLDNTQRRITVGRTPLDVWSVRRRDLYLTTHNTHNRQTSMPPVGFEPTISACERPQTYALDRAATGTGESYIQHKILNTQPTKYYVNL